MWKDRRVEQNRLQFLEYLFRIVVNDEAVFQYRAQASASLEIGEHSFAARPIGKYGHAVKPNHAFTFDGRHRSRKAIFASEIFQGDAGSRIDLVRQFSRPVMEKLPNA
jgi:hypothetical protein